MVIEVAFFPPDRTIDSYFHKTNGVSNQKKYFPNGRQIKEREETHSLTKTKNISITVVHIKMEENKMSF